MFVERDETVENVIQIIAIHSEELGGTFKLGDKSPKEVKTMYLDTKAYELNQKFNFFLRIREKPDEYDITLKCRHHDRYMAASYDLSDPVKNSDLKFKEYKFEEDITSPVQSSLSHQSTFHSKFSSQAKFESKNIHELDRFQIIKSIYPDLEVSISPTERLVKVNEFEAHEVTWSLGHVVVPEGDEIKSEVSMWYSSDKDKKPMIVELDFDCKALNDTDKMSLEQFPFPMVESINHLYASLQYETIVRSNDVKDKN